jgi:hypothetical protein
MTGGEGEGEGEGASCFIATCIYGPFSREVQVLKRFRDSYLVGNTLGRAFLRIYYGSSLFMIKLLSRLYPLQISVRWGLNRAVKFIERRGF